MGPEKKYPNYMTPAGLANLLRMSLVGMVSLAITFGYVSADRDRSQAQPALATFAILLIIGLFFHVALFVHNDLCDLEIDRTEPRRQGFPLVTGTVSPAQAWVIVIVCLVATFALDAAVFGARLEAVLLLTAASCGIGFYNAFGKRITYPYLTDFVQGAGWAALVVYAAARTSAPSVLTWLTAVHYAIYIAFVSGVHGALRDLANDYARGARTTAIMLGARPALNGPIMSQPLERYAWGLQVAMTGLAVSGVPFFDFSHIDALIISICITCFSVTAFLLLFRAFQATHDQRRLDLTGAMHMIFAYGPAAGLAAGRSRWPVALFTFTVMAAPLAGNARFRYAARHLRQLISGQEI